MISLSEIVLRLRTCSLFLDTTANRGRVGGISAFDNAMETSADLPVPHCFVLPLYGQDMTLFEAGPLQKERRQTIRQYFATIVCLDNSRARAGGKGTGDLAELDQLVVVQKAIVNLFQGWQPVQKFTPIRYHRDSYLKSDNKRLWHQFEWYLDYDNDPYASPEQEAAIAAIVNGMDGDIPFSDSLLNTLRKIYVTYRVENGAKRADAELPKKTWDDFFGHVFCESHASDAEVAAKVAAVKNLLPVLPSDADPRSEPDLVRDHTTVVETPPNTGAGHGIVKKEGEA